MKRLLCAMLSVLGACALPTPDDTPAMPAGNPLQPPVDRLFVQGPEIVGDQQLAEWLATCRDEAGPVLLRLPFRIAPETPGERRRSSLAASTAAVLDVELDDSSLGIGLSDRVRSSHAGPGPCAAWLEGNWDGSRTPPRFRVTRWVSALSADEMRRKLYVRIAVAAGSDPALVGALEELGREVPAATKAAANEVLLGGGIASLPLLIASLADERPYEQRDAVNRINLPAQEQPDPVMVTRTVGTHCAVLLHRIVTPTASRDFDFRAKVLSPQVLEIRDWPAFWWRRRGRDLAAIHAELTPLVDRYWQQGGRTQHVD